MRWRTRPTPVSKWSRSAGRYDQSVAFAQIRRVAPIRGGEAQYSGLDHCRPPDMQKAPPERGLLGWRLLRVLYAGRRTGGAAACGQVGQLQVGRRGLLVALEGE